VRRGFGSRRGSGGFLPFLCWLGGRILGCGERTDRECQGHKDRQQAFANPGGTPETYRHNGSLRPKRRAVKRKGDPVATPTRQTYGEITRLRNMLVCFLVNIIGKRWSILER